MSPNIIHTEIPLDQIVFDHETCLFPYSPREKIDRELILRIKKSIAEYGFLGSIIVRFGTMEGIAGNHRFLAYREYTIENDLEPEKSKISALLVGCDESQAHTIGFIANNIRENITEWEWIQGILLLYDKNPGAVENILGVDAQVVEAIKSWIDSLAYVDEIDRKKQGSTPRLDRDWIRIINSLLKDHPDLRLAYLRKMSDYQWVRNHTKETLAHEILENLLSAGCKFDETRWNKEPTQLCLGGKFPWKGLLEKLRASENNLLNDNHTAEGCCPFLQLELSYHREFVPSAQGKSYQRFSQKNLINFPQNIVDLEKGIVTGDYNQVIRGIEGYCVDPGLDKPNCCFAQREFESAQSVKDKLASAGEPVLLESEIHQKPGNYLWRNPKSGVDLPCTLEYCQKLNGSDKYGYRMVIKPDGSQSPICINESCGEHHKEVVEKGIVREQNWILKLPNELAERVIYKLVVDSRDDSLTLYNPQVLGVLESQLTPRWDHETRLLIAQSWKKSMEKKICEEISSPPRKGVVKEIFDQRFSWFPDPLNQDNVEIVIAKIRDICFSSENGALRWIATLALVKECQRHTQKTLDWEIRTKNFVEDFARNILGE